MDLRGWNSSASKFHAFAFAVLRSAENDTSHSLSADPYHQEEMTLRPVCLYYIFSISLEYTCSTNHGSVDLLAVALREVKEEAGISHVCPVSEEIFSLESLTVDGHVKKGKYVSSHLHLNVHICWKQILRKLSP